MGIYGSLSYFKINLSKLEAMGRAIPIDQMRSLKSSYKFKWMDQALKYLGTVIPVDLSHTFELYFPPLLREVQILLEAQGASS